MNDIPNTQRLPKELKTLTGSKCTRCWEPKLQPASNPWKNWCAEGFSWHNLCSWLRKSSISFSWVGLNPLGNLIFIEMNEKHHLETPQDFYGHNKYLPSAKIPLDNQEPGYVPPLNISLKRSSYLNISKSCTIMFFLDIYKSQYH